MQNRLIRKLVYLKANIGVPWPPVIREAGYLWSKDPRKKTFKNDLVSQWKNDLILYLFVGSISLSTNHFDPVKTYSLGGVEEGSTSEPFKIHQ